MGGVNTGCTGSRQHLTQMLNDRHMTTHIRNAVRQTDMDQDARQHAECDAESQAPKSRRQVVSFSA